MSAHPDHLTREEGILWRTSVSLLPRFLDEGTGMLRRRMAWDGQRLLTDSGTSPRYTAEAIKALYACRRRALDCPLQADALLNRLVREHLSSLDYPDIALTLWADALGEGRHHRLLWTALMRHLPTGDADTLHLAWTLSAICHCLPIAVSPSETRGAAYRCARRILRAQSEKTGLFRSSYLRAAWLRRPPASGTLPVQAYAIDALVTYDRACGDRAAVQRAERCAETLCRLQGPLGQWWNAYDVRSGDVTTAYPVYCVNQDSSVPMALAQLQCAGGHQRFRDAIQRSVTWVLGRNEVDEPLVNEEHTLLWRGVAESPSGSSVIRETYAYHPARVLYYLATRGGDSEATNGRDSGPA